MVLPTAVIPKMLTFQKTLWIIRNWPPTHPGVMLQSHARQIAVHRVTLVRRGHGGGFSDNCCIGARTVARHACDASCQGFVGVVGISEDPGIHPRIVAAI